MIKRLETVLCLSAVPLGAAGNTTGRMARLQKPYVRRRAKPFNSHPVSKSCAIQVYRLWMEYPSRFLDEPSMNDLAMKKLAMKLIVVVALSAQLFAQAISDQTPAKVDFRRDVQPIFKTSCYGCHGPT